MKKFFVFIIVITIVFCIGCGSGSNKKYDLSKASGEYSFEVPNNKISTAKVKVANDLKTLSFELVTATERGCTGELNGDAVLVRGTIFVYTSKYQDVECKLELKFNADTLVIAESGMCNHGAACSFNGAYTKSIK